MSGIARIWPGLAGFGRISLKIALGLARGLLTRLRRLVVTTLLYYWGVQNSRLGTGKWF